MKHRCMNVQDETLNNGFMKDLHTDLFDVCPKISKYNHIGIYLIM